MQKRNAIARQRPPTIARRTPPAVALDLALAAAAGVALALCFPPVDAPWLLMPVALAVWLDRTCGRPAGQAVATTLAFGLAFQLTLLRWATIIGADAWLALAAIEAAFLLPLGLLAARVRTRLQLLPLLALGLPATDWVRDHAGVLAFGWGQLAFASVDAPWARLAPTLGQWAVTGMAAATGAAIAALVRAGIAGRAIAAGALLLLLTVPLLRPAAASTAWDVHTIALVQGGTDRVGVGVQDRRAVLRRHADLTTRALAGTPAELVVWPENAVDVDPVADTEARTLLTQTSHRIGRPLLVGALVDLPVGRTNASVHVDGEAIRTTYMKQRLVPFGEYLPLRSVLTRLFERAALIPVDFVPGPGAGAIEVAGRTIGQLICFEVADDDLARAAVPVGTSALLVQTNNATYAGTGQGAQQLRIAQFRALELGVPVYVVSTTGPSAVIAANGRIVQAMADGTLGTLLAPLPAHRVPA